MISYTKLLYTSWNHNQNRCWTICVNPADSVIVLYSPEGWRRKWMFVSLVSFKDLHGCCGWEENEEDAQLHNGCQQNKQNWQIVQISTMTIYIILRLLKKHESLSPYQITWQKREVGTLYCCFFFPFFNAIIIKVESQEMIAKIIEIGQQFWFGFMAYEPLWII